MRTTYEERRIADIRAGRVSLEGLISMGALRKMANPSQCVAVYGMAVQAVPSGLESVEMGLCPSRGQFCRRHFSWLCGMGTGQCQKDYWGAVWYGPYATTPEDEKRIRESNIARTGGRR